MTTDTIFALSSGAGRAGVAVLRLSGPMVAKVAQDLSGDVPHPREATVKLLRDPHGAPLDEAVLIYFTKPKSFTGEDVLEIHCHGSAAVVKAVLATLGQMHGCRPAVAGEFTQRAFLNGKMDLTEVEGLSDLIAADTDLQRRAALRETIGTSRDLYTRWREELLQAIALIEALIDFSADEDIPDAALDDAARLLSGIVQEMQRHLDHARSSEILRDGLTVVLAGAPNTGKSSLLNALARRDVAIVTDEPGTTRDMIEVKLDLGGYPVTLVDTAGLRESQNKIEAEGIRRALQRAEEADLVLWLQAADEQKQNPPTDETKTWRVLSKSDLMPVLAKDKTIALSAKTGAGIQNLLDRLSAFAQERFGEDGEDIVYLRERHRQLLQATSMKLRTLVANIRSTPLEIVAEDLRHAAEPLARITGHIGAEEMLGMIFSRFCIGK
ncbi:MAG: tRNA uridine-5-carboxymethylaminomethyl(34) synthesis GTPase MnmE [Pseudomonadota bacterium]